MDVGLRGGSGVCGREHARGEVSFCMTGRCCA